MNNIKTLGDIKSMSPGKVKQAVIALSMSVQEPAVSKLERKRIADTPLKKVAQYLNALGGEVELIVTLPSGESVQIQL